jgi:hypothetical protein
MYRVRGVSEKLNVVISPAQVRIFDYCGSPQAEIQADHREGQKGSKMAALPDPGL